MRTSKNLWMVCRFHLICCFLTIRFAIISLTADSMPGTVPLTVIGHRVCVQFQITYGLRQHEREFFQRGDVLETPRLRPLPKMYQTYNSAVGEAVPKLS